MGQWVALPWTARHLVQGNLKALQRVWMSWSGDWDNRSNNRMGLLDRACGRVRVLTAWDSNPSLTDRKHEAGAMRQRSEAQKGEVRVDNCV